MKLIKQKLKGTKESAEKFQNEEKKTSDMKTKATSLEENQQTSIDYFLLKDPNEIDKKSLDFLANKIAENLNISNRFTTKTITNTEQFPESNARKCYRIAKGKDTLKFFFQSIS